MPTLTGNGNANLWSTLSKVLSGQPSIVVMVFAILLLVAYGGPWLVSEIKSGYREISLQNSADQKALRETFKEESERKDRWYRDFFSRPATYSKAVPLPPPAEHKE